MLNKKIGKDFRDNIIKNIALICLIVMSVAIIVGFNRSMDGYSSTVKKMDQECNVEDGHFEALELLTKLQKKAICNTGAEVQNNFIFDYEKEDYKVRFLSGENEINQLRITKGRALSSKKELVLDEKFATEHNYKIGDTFSLKGEKLKIVGYGITPDYVYTVENKNDFMNNPKKFGVGYLTQAFISDQNWERSGGNTYSFLLKDTTYKEFKKAVDNNTEISDITIRKDNPRIEIVFDDVSAPKKFALIVGALLLAIIIFVITIAVVNNIREERIVIGILYAQGYRKQELLRHYLIMPLLMSVIGGALGYFAGMLISAPLTNIQTEYNVPKIEFDNSPYLIFLGIVLPIILALIISLITISRELRKHPLKLMYGIATEQKKAKSDKRAGNKASNLKNFILRFRMKGIKQDAKSYMILFVGVLLASMILNMAFFVRDSSQIYVDSIESKIPYKQMYTLYGPEPNVDLAKTGEKCSVKSMKMHIKDRGEKTVTLQGMKSDSDYFSVDGLKKDEVAISSCLRDKFAVDVGDKIKMRDVVKDKEYAFTVKKVISYDIAQCVFIRHKDYLDTFDLQDDYYNAILSQEDLSMKEDNLIAKTTRKDAAGSADALLAMVGGLSAIMIAAASVIMVIIVFLLMQMIVKKSQINISMMRIFGYRKKEVQQLYMRGNIVFVLAAYILSFSIARLIASAFYSSVFENMQQYFKTAIEMRSIVISLIIVLAAYLISVLLTKRSCNRIAFAEAIKNRE